MNRSNVKAWWLGHSAFRFESPEGKVIYIDPFLSQNPKTPGAHKKPDDADYILLTHGHEDHVGDTLDLADRTGCRVVAQVELSALLQQDGLPAEQSIEFNKGGTLQLDDFTVTLVSANHSSSFKGRYAGEAGGLVVSFRDEMTFYHMGDTNIFSDLRFYATLYKPDWVAVPIGDYYTMGPEEAALCCEMIGSKQAIPIHYGTFPVLTGDPGNFKSRVEKQTSTQVVIPEPGSRFLG